MILISSLFTESLAFEQTLTSFSVAETGNDVSIIEVTETADAEYTKVLVHMHGMGQTNEYAAAHLLEHGWYGDSIEGLKVIFPQATNAEHPTNSLVSNYYYDGEYQALAFGWESTEESLWREEGCPNISFFSECTWDLGMIEISGK